jgi:Zn-dependent peptidase ImmA (M78 family)
MSAKERDAAIAAGCLGLELSRWIDERFNLHRPNILDLSYETDPEVASRAVRQHWGIGEKPIGNMLHLLEANGVRIFSLAENTASVDAFSFWRDETPLMFLNNFKTAEHSIFDSAHELGHLVLHGHGGPPSTRAAEREANLFASALLMPMQDVRERMPRMITTDVILVAKTRWRVSAMAMAHRLHDLCIVTDRQYKSICIELGRRGYRSAEPGGIERETSSVWQKILTQLWAERVTKEEIARDLSIPLDELEGLIWGLTGAVRPPESPVRRPAFHAVS